MSAFDYNGKSSESTASSWSTSPRTASYVKESSPNMSSAGRQTASYENLVAGRCTLGDIMKEFSLNGSESDFTPADDDNIWGTQTGLGGMGPSSAYLRQKSWPEPDRTPIQRLPVPKPTDWNIPAEDFSPTTTSTPYQEMNSVDLLLEKRNVLNTLPNSVLFYLLHELEMTREGYRRGKGKLYNECRFCKNNGERESYYRSHSLKDALGRVVCPVLRAYVCARCGARGDFAHTAKYCPLITAEERVNCTAMMRSVRMASGRRRKYLSPSDGSGDNYMIFGDTTPSVISDTNTINTYHVPPLEPQWAALEQKLML